MKDEFDAFFDEIPSDDAPADEREKFLSQFKRKSRPADRLGRLSFDGKQIAAEIVKLAGEQGIEAAKSRIDAIEADPSRGYALLYAAQLAMPKVSSDPAMYVELAKAIAAASTQPPVPEGQGPRAAGLPRAGHGRGAAPRVERAELPGQCRQKRARLRVPPASRSFRRARIQLRSRARRTTTRAPRRASRRTSESPGSSFARRSRRVQLYGQENWAGQVRGGARNRSCLSAGSQRRRRALLRQRAPHLHPEQDELVLREHADQPRRARSCSSGGSTRRRRRTRSGLLVRASSQPHRRYCSSIRYGLASIDLLKGQPTRALHPSSRSPKMRVAAGLPACVSFPPSFALPNASGGSAATQEMLERVRARCASSPRRAP